MEVSLGGPQPHQRSRSKGDKGTKTAVQQAKVRARKRLQALFPDLFDIFYAEERARVGLDPWPIELALRRGPDPDCQQTMGFAHVYHALEEYGVETDGPQR